MKNTPLKIFTFIIVTLMAIAAVIAKINPELIPIPKIIEKLYAAINNVLPLEKGDDLNLLIVLAAIIMPLFAGIMRSISDITLNGIKCVAALFAFVVGCFIVGGIITMFFGILLIYLLFKVCILSMVLSYLFCCFLIFADNIEFCNSDCNCHSDCNYCCVGECY